MVSLLSVSVSLSVYIYLHLFARKKIQLFKISHKMIVTVNSKNNVNYRFVAIQSGETTDFKMILHVGHP